MAGPDDDESFSWDSSETEEETTQAAAETSAVSPPAAAAAASNDANEGSSSQSSIVSHFVMMGFSAEMVAKAIKDNEERGTEGILDILLNYAAIGKDCSEHDGSLVGHSTPDASSNDDDYDDIFDNDVPENQEFTEDFSEEDRKLLTLVDMGFPIDEASSAITRCGMDASVLELADSIYAAQMAEESGSLEARSPPICNSSEDEPIKESLLDFHKDRKRKKPVVERIFNAKRAEVDDDSEDDTEMCQLPNPMIGFGFPNGMPITKHRNLPEVAIGPPYFYYENVALAPKGVWHRISRFLYDIKPEFVDSKYFCATARKRGYIHNLPIENRFPAHPMPPQTIHEAFPSTRKWWPSWDRRTQLNCVQTCTASAKTAERIRTVLANCGDPPPLHVQKFVRGECSKWNLLWVGLHKVAPLEPDEIEMLLGFPKDHTRGGGCNRTERYRSLGNSFQVDTVAYHLSVLKGLFPNGITVLSLFSGIGGAEVALHRLGIHLKAVVSVEISEVNRNIIRAWWEQTNQTGQLIEYEDVQNITDNLIESLINRFGGFDLVIGGSPCNNLTGSNRHTRHGLEGKHSSLFFEYYRILDLVKCLMGKKA